MNGSSAQERLDPWKPASKAEGNLPSNRPHTFQQNTVVQHNGTYHQFNPAQAAFMPASTGVEVQQVSRALNVPQHHNELIDVVHNNHIQHLTETARLGHVQRGLAQELDEFRYNTANDINVMKQHVMSLTSSQVVASEQKQIEPSKAEVEYGYYYTNPDCCPSEEMLRDLPKEQIAQSYINEAETRELSAFALRKQALELCPEMKQEKEHGCQLKIEAAPMTAKKMATPGFACCETEFSAIGELVEHVEQTHTVPEHRLLGRTRSKAVEIKSPPNEPNASNGNHAVPNEKQHQKETSPWMPFAVRTMPAMSLAIPENMETFSFEFLRATFGGAWWSPGYYFIAKNSMLPCKAYWILDLANEPFLPQQPGAHGAKLTAFFNETVSGVGQAPEVENYENVPVFIKAAGKDEYTYFGNYSQLRFSDKLGYDTIASEVPDSVLRNHAEQLAEIGRPAWVTEALREHFWPKPRYEGPIPTDSALNSPATSVQNGNSITIGQEKHVMKALVTYAADLKDWQKDSKLKVSLLTTESIFDSFHVADADEEPGLRLFWEYQQCVGWDAGFYKMLVGLKANAATKLEIGGEGKKRIPSVDRDDGSTAAKMGLSSEATYTPMKSKAKGVEEYPGPDAKTTFVRPNFDAKPVAFGGVKNGAVGNRFGRKDEGMMNGGASKPTGPKGDLRAAQEFSASVKKSGEKSVPPHLRARK